MNNEEKNLPNEENDLPLEEVKNSEEIIKDSGEASETAKKKLPLAAIIGIAAGAVAVIVAVVLILVLGNKGCEHTFSEKWYSDATQHWHPATCEHAETERGSLADHVDADENGFCDVCEYNVKHTHAFKSDWTITETHHWKAATCSHTDQKENYGTHSDEDLNGACDVCSGHVHSVNGAGYCKYSDCGKKVRDIDEDSLDDLINAVLEQKKLVNGGTIDYSFTGRSNTGSAYEVSRKELVSYIFGKDNYTYTNVTSKVNNGGVEASGTLETWHQLMGADQVFGVVSQDGEPLVLDVSDTGKLNGYYIALSTLAGDYGVEETLYALYEAAIADTTNELTVIPDTAANKVTFKYSYKTVIINESEIAVGDETTPVGSKVYNVNQFEVEVTFTYSDDFALTSLMIAVDCYTNDPGLADGYGFLYPDADIVYDPETDTITFVEYKYEDGEWVAYPTDKRTPDTYVINVTQTVGDRTEENPNSQSKFVPEHFDLFHILNEDGSLENKYKGNVIQANVRDIIHLYVGNCTPEGTSIHFTHQMISLKGYRNGVQIENIDAYDNEQVYAVFTFSGEQRMFLIIPKMDGLYKFEIYLGDKIIYEVEISVGIVDEEHFDLEDNEFLVKVTETYTWAGEVIFTATESGKYYFNVPAGIGFMDADKYDEYLEQVQNNNSQQDIVAPNAYFDFQASGKENGGSFSIVLEEGQTIRFYVSGKNVGTYVISYSVI